MTQKTLLNSAAVAKSMWKITFFYLSDNAGCPGCMMNNEQQGIRLTKEQGIY